ncbi:MAG TPA: thioredoxin domain-containing protein [Deinococcales bacterium]|nr:thioredoxin domain-containing protein [Deinococcales bacterium]
MNLPRAVTRVAAVVAVACLGTAGLAAGTPASPISSVRVTYQTPEGPQQVEARRVKGNALAGARFVAGKAGAANTIVEFGNYLCSHCGNWAGEVQPQLLRDLVDAGKVRFAYRDLPFTRQANARLASGAAACAADQGRFWAFHDLLYATAGRWAGLEEPVLRSQLNLYAAAAGLNAAAFSACQAADRHLAAVDADVRAANALGIAATPAFIVNGWLVEGELPLAAFKALLKLKP